jgi:N-acetylglucosamine-6-sulfatase
MSPRLSLRSRSGTLRLTVAAGLSAIALLGVPVLAKAERPNIVIIQTDDQNARTVRSTFRKASGQKARIMPNTLREIFGAGTEFQNYYATSPICSPSRASLLSGQYPHNNGLIENDAPYGGWDAWQNLPSYSQNLPVALQSAGYRTSHFGKFINGYYDSEAGQAETVVPPGWDNWYNNSFFKGALYYGFEVNNNGVLNTGFGDPLYEYDSGLDPKRCDVETLTRQRFAFGCNHLTDTMTRAAVREIRKNQSEPLFMQIDYQAPHGDVRAPVGAQPASRHAGAMSRTSLPRPANYNEADVSDKSELIQSYATPRLDYQRNQRLKRTYRRYIASLRAVDDGVGAIIKTLRNTGKLDDTYIFFLSDHGYFLGEHRFDQAKFLPYDASSRVAMAVRGPKVPVGGRSEELVGNVDIAPTALQIAGVTGELDVDGRSINRFWKDPLRSSRRPLGLALPPEPPEEPSGGASVSASAPALRYDGFMVGPYKYFRFDDGGEAELYDMDRDPWELENVIDSPEYVQVKQYMEAFLPQVGDCAGVDCRLWLPKWPEPALEELPPES